LIQKKKLRDSARDEECTLEILGVCNSDPSTVVLCHFPDECGGMAMKTDDICAGYGCSSCHVAIDSRGSCPEFDQRADWYLRRSQTRSMRRILDVIGGVAEYLG
jgi:hypothetical protein